MPRGAVVVDAQKRVIPNAYFEGLSFQTAGEKRAYYHFRKPESLQGLALMKKPGIVKSGDFMDSITKDFPQGAQTLLTALQCSALVSIRMSLIAVLCTVARRDVGDWRRPEWHDVLCAQSVLGWLYFLHANRITRVWRRLLWPRRAQL